MKKFAILFLILVFGSICFAQDRDRFDFGFKPREVTAPSMGFPNAVYVSPGDDIKAKLDWLMSSDRDSVWGTASFNNKRTLVFTPGVCILDANFVEPYHHIILQGIDEAILNCPADSNYPYPVIRITGRDIEFKNLVVRNTAIITGYHPANTEDWCGISLLIDNSGFYINATIDGNNITKTGSHFADGLVDNQINPNVTDHNNPTPFIGKWDIVLVNDKDGGVTPGWYAVKSVTDSNTVVIWGTPGNSTGDVFLSVCCQHVLIEGNQFYTDKYDISEGSTVLGCGYIGHGGGIWRNNITGVGGIRTQNPRQANLPYDYTDVPIKNGTAATDIGNDMFSINIGIDHNIPWSATVVIYNTTKHTGVWPVVGVDPCCIYLPALYVESETFGSDDMLQRVYYSWLIIDCENNIVGPFSIGGDKQAATAGYIINNICANNCINSCTSYSMPLRYAIVQNNKCGNASIGLDTWIMNTEISGNDCGYASIGGKVTASGSYSHVKIWNSIIENNKVRYNNSYDSYGLKSNISYYGKTPYYINKGDLSLSVLKNNWYGSQSDRTTGVNHSGEILYFENNVIEGMAPEGTCSKTASCTVYGVDNGAVFNNNGASGAVTFTIVDVDGYLPNNFSATFRDVNNTAGVDVIVDCSSSDHFQYGDTIMSNGESYKYDDDTGEIGQIKIRAVKPSTLLIENQVGTGWVEETP